MEKKYTKLKELVDDEFTVEKAWGYNWQMWDEGERRMVRSDEWKQGFRKVYQVDTDKGKLDLSENQIGSMLAGALDVKAGGSQLVGETFKVKSNGKSGMDIRYYINHVKNPQVPKPDTSGSDDLYNFEGEDFV